MDRVAIEKAWRAHCEANGMVPIVIQDIVVFVAHADHYEVRAFGYLDPQDNQYRHRRFRVNESEPITFTEYAII